MTTEKLLNSGYFPKELPPCFFSDLLGANFNTISADLDSNEEARLSTFQNQANTLTTSDEIKEEKLRLKQVFKNRLRYSECAQYSIPKPGLARNIIKIPNPLHQGKLAYTIATNYIHIEKLFGKSNLSTTKPKLETEISQGKRSVKHDNFGVFLNFRYNM